MQERNKISSWIQFALAISVIMIELYFLLMCQYGWSLGTGNLVAGMFINLVLVGLGVTLLGEKVSFINAKEIASYILGVALTSYRPRCHLEMSEEESMDE